MFFVKYKKFLSSPYLKNKSKCRRRSHGVYSKESMDSWYNPAMMHFITLLIHFSQNLLGVNLFVGRVGG